MLWTKEKTIKEFKKLVKKNNNACPSSSQIKGIKSLYYGMRKNSFSTQELCDHLGIKYIFRGCTHFSYKEKFFTVKSHAEMQIALFLLATKIPFKYEKPILKTRYKSDFFLPQSNTYIEYWGFKGAKGAHGLSYSQKMKKKKKEYKKAKLDLLNINFKREKEIKHIFLTLKRQLKKRRYLINLTLKEFKKIILDTDSFHSSKKYNNKIFFKEYLKIHRSDLTLKEIHETNPIIFNYINSYCGHNYSKFLKDNNLYNKKLARKASFPTVGENLYKPYKKVAKEFGYNPSPTELKKKHAWLYGRIQREYKSFRNFKRKYRFLPQNEIKDVGVSFRKDKKFKRPWRARININNKTVTLGQFTTKEEAFMARQKFIEKNNWTDPRYG